MGILKKHRHLFGNLKYLYKKSGHFRVRFLNRPTQSITFVTKKQIFELEI